MMLRVYMDGKLKREERGEWHPVELEDRGRIVCGVEIPAGRKLLGRPVERRGKRVHRIDFRTVQCE